MIELKGKYGTAKVFTDNIELTAQRQIIELLNQSAFRDSQVRIMPDTHAGAGCVIGFTGGFNDTIIPNIVGYDIGCGMLATNLGKVHIDFQKLDDFIREEVAFGFKTNSKMQLRLDNKFYNKMSEIAEKTKHNQKHSKVLNTFMLSIGSLGGGNHFIEINEDKNGDKWLVIHTGSRNLGNRIAKYHQAQAEKHCKDSIKELNDMKKIRISKLRSLNKSTEIPKDDVIIDCEEAILFYSVPKQLSFLQSELAEDYLKDMRFAQEYAELNREILSNKILRSFGGTIKERFETVHNYFDFETKLVRKGAISAKEGEKVLIPINMRDGSIIAVGKGNEDWNNSAPHGAGRLMSRSKAKENVNLEEFKETMKDVWSTSVNENTLDESPMAYKTVKEIIDNTEDTLEIVDVIKPLYNFKA